MATLNTSIEGAAISKAYQAVVEAPLAAPSPTYAQWAIYAVQAPLASSFQNDSGKESVLKVFRTGEGELSELAEDFSEGKIQFGFVKVKDPNTSLPKSVLIAWCGQGVPERTKGYYTSHLATVAKILHGYHVQVSARSDDDLQPDVIIRKVQDASGSKYSGGGTAPRAAGGPAPPVATKPVFTPSRIGAASTFQPLGARSRTAAPSGPVDSDGWGDDAPPVSRSQLEKVDSAYKPTKVNMAELTSQKQEPSRFTPAPSQTSAPEVVRGAYQPVGKVDIAAIRREAQQKGSSSDDRPTVVKGAYEPVGKVDIAAIRAKAQAAPPPSSTISPARTGASTSMSPARTGTSVTSAGAPAENEPKSLADRTAAFSGNDGRLSSMPKPKPAGKFGGASAFGGTRAPVPGGFDAQPAAPAAAQIGAASRTFADQGGKTPAQLWAEKKGGAGGGAPAPSVPLASQTSGNAAAGWQSGYSGKKWGAVQTTHAAGVPVNATDEAEEPQREQETPASSAPGGIGSIRDQFKDAQPIGMATERAAPAPPPMDFSSKPNTGINRAVPVPSMGRPAEETANIPPPPAQPPRTPTPEQDEEEERAYSPVRIAQPVARTEEKPLEKPEEPQAALPVRSLEKHIPAEHELEDEPAEDPARAAGQTVAEQSSAKAGGQTAVVSYDYTKDEPNEIDLVEGQTVTNIEQVDADWWYGQNEAGEMGLFPSNYVEIIEGGAATAPPPAPAPAAHVAPAAPVAPTPAAAPAASAGKTATAEYDYEADEPNELSFPEGATITNVEFPDDDWWLGECGGKQGLFPANYVKLD